MTTVVSNASALIALDRMGRLDLLRLAAPTILIPPAVAQEIGRQLTANPLLTVVPFSGGAMVPLLPSSLGDGERDAIILAAEIKADRVILDDLSARSAALRRGLPIVGTVGLLMEARRQSLVPPLAQTLVDLRNVGFHLSDALFRLALEDLGESPPR